MALTISGSIRAMFGLFARNRATMFGSTFAAFSLLTLLALSALEIGGLLHSPYIGVLSFVIMPALLMFGMMLFVIGLFRKASASYRAFDFAPGSPFDMVHLNIRDPRTRQALGMAGFLSCVNLFVFGVSSYHGVVYVDSNEFCGMVCHTPMEPQFTAFKDSPHSHIECVQCHVGRGAEAFVEAKLAGLRQVAGVAFGSYARPIPSPHQSLRPARETCENCHAPSGAFSGDTMRMITRFADDEASTPENTVLVMHMGTQSAPNGIHSWHLAEGREVTYEALDDSLERIVKVSVKESDGSVTVYQSDRSAPKLDGAAETIKRTMDCIDCHNRPSHQFRSPEDVVDRALAGGELDRSLPNVRKVAVDALAQTQCADGDLDRIAQRIVTHYRAADAAFYSEHAAAVAKAVGSVQAIYRRNVFPEMHVTWDTYVDHSGHVRSAGCFRCHNDTLVTSAGKPIGQDCTICHGVVAMQENNPKILEDLGIASSTATGAVANAMQ